MLVTTNDVVLEAKLLLPWHHVQTQGPTTTAKLELNVTMRKMISRTVAVIYVFT